MHIYICLRKLNWTLISAVQKSLIEPYLLEASKTLQKQGFRDPPKGLQIFRKMHPLLCPWFLEFFRRGHFRWSRFVKSRKHYKNRGFGDTTHYRRKNVKFARCLCVLRRSARFSPIKLPLLAPRTQKCFFFACAWNHCFYSGFRHTHWEGACSCGLKPL